MKPYAFLLAGHSNWGKSRTLLSFSGNRRPRGLNIHSMLFAIRRMSNDDFNKKFREYIDLCLEDTSENLIIAFCPNFEISGRYALDTLQRLSAHYQIHVFALRHRYGTDQIITDHEIATMEGFGEVRVYEETNKEAPERAEAFRRYIDEVIARRRS